MISTIIYYGNVTVTKCVCCCDNFEKKLAGMGGDGWEEEEKRGIPVLTKLYCKKKKRNTGNLFSSY